MACYWPQDAIVQFPNLLLMLHAGAFHATMLLAVLAAVPLWICCLGNRQLRLSLPVHLHQMLIFAAGWFLFFICMASLDGRYVAWFMD